jgi:hypothetical protein
MDDRIALIILGEIHVETLNTLAEDMHQLRGNSNYLRILVLVSLRSTSGFKED